MPANIKPNIDQFSRRCPESNIWADLSRAWLTLRLKRNLGNYMPPTVIQPHGQWIRLISKLLTEME